jgi:hypothetical protein
MSDEDMQREQKINDSSRALREKHCNLTASVKIKISLPVQGRSQGIFESWVHIK